MKVTVTAPANIAFIKYWGRSDHELFLPRNNNISMTMNGCMTTTTVGVSDKLKSDIVEVQFHGNDYKKLSKESIKEKNLYDQIERIRKMAKEELRTAKVHVKSTNNFPADAGIASSASGFAALTSALLLAFGLDEKFDDKQELSREIRLCGSGSAVRSVHDGFVEMIAGADHESTYAEQIAPEDHWDLVDIVAIVNPEKKLTSSSQGHMIADTSPYFETRIEEMQQRIQQVREAILAKDLKKLGLLIEQESTSMHTVMMTSDPPIYYWTAGTMAIMRDLHQWRSEDDLHAYFTIDAGPNVHVICEGKDAAEVTKRLEANDFVQWTIANEPCKGATVVDEHLF